MEIQELVRDGQTPWLTGNFPRFLKPQQKLRAMEVQEREAAKVLLVRVKNYIETGDVNSLTHFFLVPKAKGTDICMVYNGTSSGLNSVLWALHFFLPTMSAQLRALKEGTYMGDMDIREMFLNFMLHEFLRAVWGGRLIHSFNGSKSPEMGRGATKQLGMLVSDHDGSRSLSIFLHPTNVVGEGGCHGEPT